MINTNSQLMPWIAYKMMTFVMHIRKRFRNIESEITFPGTRSSDTVVDYGCGPGFNTIPLARDIVKNGKVYALDNNPNAINDIVRKANALNLKNIETIASGYPKGISEESIDIVFLHNVLPYIKDKESVLAGIHRILKPQGKLSYMSRKIAHAVGKRETGETAMTDEELTKYLETNYSYQLIKKDGGHLVFEKQEN